MILVDTAVAINRGLELFTFNTKHFQRIEELVLFI